MFLEIGIYSEHIEQLSIELAKDIHADELYLKLYRHHLLIPAKKRKSPFSFRRMFRPEGQAPMNIDVHFAWRGKIILYNKLIERNNITSNEKIVGLYKIIIEQWLEFLNQHQSKIIDQLKKDYATDIEKYQGISKNLSRVLNDKDEAIVDFDYYIKIRDILELFLIGVESELPKLDFRTPIIGIDHEIKPFIMDELVPFIRKEHLNKPHDIIALTNLQWLPEYFWWRHLS